MLLAPHLYTYGRSMLIYGRNQHNIVIILQLKIIFKKRNLEKEYIIKDQILYSKNAYNKRVKSQKKSASISSFLLLLLLLSHISHLRLCATPIDGSPPGSPIPGILQARTLEWVAISFSNAWKWKVKVKSFSRVRLFATPWTAAYQAPPPMGVSRQEYWSGSPVLLHHLF